MEYKPKPVGDSRPSTYYATQTQFWGTNGLTEKQKAEAKDRSALFNGKEVKITYSPGGKLFVLNQGNEGRGLHICPNCGFTKDPIRIIRGNKHDTKYKKPCSSKRFINASLGHVFSTDIIKIVLPKHEVKMKLPEGTEEKNMYLSVLYAIIEGACKALDISRSDISGCLTENQEIVLFDDTAGGSGFVKHIFMEFEKVIREARNKVSGMCGCTPETSCYGCLRNYSNQFFHDQISRGLAYEYLTWLIEEMAKNTNKKEKVIDKKHEDIGIKTFDYKAPDTSTYPDTLTVLEDLGNTADDESFKEGLRKLALVAKGMKLENPLTEEKISVKEKDIWPELFWGKSKVALFTVDERTQYDIMRKYDWYCYIIDENIDAETVLGHVKEE